MTSIGHNGAPEDGGWIKKYRTVRDHWLVGHGIHVKPGDPSKNRCHTQGEAWEDLLMECRYEDGFVNNGGKKMELRRGELIGAVSWLAHRWNWTPKIVRRFLDQLENEGMISLVNPASKKGIQKGRQSKVISVCKYDYYQSHGESVGYPEGQPEGIQRATRGHPEGNTLRKKEEKNGRARARMREVQEPCQFEAFNGASTAGTSTQTEGDLVINGTTIRHKNFTIDLAKIEMQLATRINVRRDQVKAWSLDIARRWSEEWKKKIVPIGAHNPTKYIVEYILEIDNPRSEIRIEGEKIVLDGQKREFWIGQFGGDENQLDLALLQAAPYIRTDRKLSLAAQVEAQLARQAGDIKVRQKNSRDIADRRSSEYKRRANEKPKETAEEIKARYDKIQNGGW